MEKNDFQTLLKTLSIPYLPKYVFRGKFIVTGASCSSFLIYVTYLTTKAIVAAQF